MIKKLLLISLSLFLIISPAFCQEAAKNKVVVLDDFSKGLNTKLSPFSLLSSQADICENVRLNEQSKSLEKRSQVLLFGAADATEAITGIHRLYLKSGTKVLLATHGDEIEKGSDSAGTFTPILSLTTGDYRWQWTTWNNVAIGTDGYNQPVKYDGSSASATYLGTCLATVSTTAGTAKAGTYTYKVTFYTTTYEVLLGVASNSIVNPGSFKITLSMIPIGPDTYGGETVIGRKIYRLEGATWNLLEGTGATGPGTIENNTTTSVTDDDAVAGGAAYPTVNGTTVIAATPPKGKLCLIHYNRLFLANDPNAPSRLYYSDDGNVDYFLPTDYYWDIRPDDGDQITFIKTFLGLLTVGKENTIQKFYTDGASPAADWSVSNVFSNIGCKAMYSAQDTPIGIIYLGSDGLYKFNGQYSTLLSDAVAPEIKDILESNRGNVWAQYHKSTYYLSYPSKKTGVSTNNRILLYDLISNAYSIDILNANCFAAFNSGTDWDTLYYGSSTNGNVYNYTSQTYELVHNKHSDFSGTFTNARYIPTGVAGGDENNPIIEIARTGTINGMSGIINNLTGTIDRDSLTGSYISQALNLGASKFDKIYWNERFVSSGDNITLATRSATTEAGLTGAFSAEVSDPSGSDISNTTNFPPNTWVQYRVSLTTDAYAHSPEVYKANNYNIKLTYFKEAATTETAISMHWRSGFLDLGFPGYTKSLTKIYCFYDSDSAGTLNLTFKNLEGDAETFLINLTNNPSSYIEYFTGGKFLGEKFRLDITESSLYNLSIKQIILVFDVEPLY